MIFSGFYMKTLGKLRYRNRSLPRVGVFIDFHSQNHIRIAVETGKPPGLYLLLPCSAIEGIDRHDLLSRLSSGALSTKTYAVNGAGAGGFVRFLH